MVSVNTHANRLLEHKAHCEVRAVWLRLIGLFPRLGKFPPPDLAFNIDIGNNLAMANFETRTIEINMEFYKRNIFDYHDEIIAHECAHIAAWDLFKHAHHGKPWRRVMRQLGLKAKVRYQVVFPPAKAGRDNPAVSGI